MIKTILLYAALFISMHLPAKSFEGKLMYKNSYKSKMPNVTDQQLATMMGSTEEYYIKAGDYKSVTNGSLVLWQVYINSDNKLYSKMSNAEAVYWTDGATNQEEILKAEVKRNVTEILGYKCDEVILTCKSGVQQYYFNAKLSVDPGLFVKHKYGNWYEFLSKSHSLPLRSVIDNKNFTIESIATDIKPMHLDKNLFVLPANTKTTPMPG